MNATTNKAIAQAVQRAIGQFQAGNLAAAESFCRQALKLDSGEINALHILGLVALQSGNPHTAVELISRAISGNRTVAAFHISLGNALQAGGALQKAINAYQTALKLDSRIPVAHNNLANVYSQLRQLQPARRHFQRAVELQPNYAPARLGLGNIFNHLGQYEQALECYRQALELQPHYPEAHCYMGAVFRNSGRTQEAIEHLKRALEQRPDYADALSTLGSALQDDRQYESAAECFRRLLRNNPDDANCHYNLGNCLYHKGAMDEALEHFEQAVSLRPEFYQAHSNLGNALYITGQNSRALQHLQRAVELAPDYPEAHNNLGCLLKDIGQLKKAVHHFERAVSAKPDFTEAQSNIGVALHALGDLDEAIACYEKTLQLQPDKADTFSNLLLALNYSADYDSEAIFLRHRQYAARLEAQSEPAGRHHPNSAEPDRKLRIGYVSPDFRDHSVAFFIEPVLKHHARERFEIFCYYNHVKVDSVTRRLQEYADRWRNIAAIPDDEVATLLREDRIDILVDLAGHTAMNRLPVFARKPAPVQVTWLGYLNTSGLSSMDYRITDAHATPPGASDRYNVEKLIRMPDSQWCYQPPSDAPPAHAPVQREGQPVTFGSFHTLAKITAPVTRLWSEVLHAVPEARLLMVARGLEQQEVQEEVLSRFAQHGIDSGRIAFLGSQSFDDYLRLHQGVDINLDTTPYTGGTTTCHSLWMGVPVITLAGNTATSRGGASLLSAVGLDELIADTDDAFIDIARSLASDPEKLGTIRQELRRRVTDSPLTDAAAFTHNLEQVYRDIWTTWCAAQTG